MVQRSLHSNFYLILRLKYLPAHLSSADPLVLVFSPNLDFIFYLKFWVNDCSWFGEMSSLSLFDSCINFHYILPKNLLLLSSYLLLKLMLLQCT